MAKRMKRGRRRAARGTLGAKFPLHAALRTGDIDAMTQQDGGAAVDKVALFVTCEHGYVDAVRLLLERGAGVGRQKTQLPGAGVAPARLRQAPTQPNVDLAAGVRRRCSLRAPMVRVVRGAEKRGEGGGGGGENRARSTWSGGGGQVRHRLRLTEKQEPDLNKFSAARR